MRSLSIAETFYSLQGEGRTVGVPAFFVRLAGCNLMCGGAGTEKDGHLHDGATWRCDTIEVWLKGKAVPHAELLDDLENRFGFLQRLSEGAHLVFTGGEPLLQQDRIVDFLFFLEKNHGLRPVVEVETNATVMPLSELDARVHFWNTSPKLHNSGMPDIARRRPEVLRWFAANPRTMSKFVVSDIADWDEIRRDFLEPDLVDPKHLVLMPAVDRRSDIPVTYLAVAQLCIREGVRMGVRLHVEIWDRLTGV
jgi:7-carboxy-7-deazaguanine synthase